MQRISCLAEGHYFRNHVTNAVEYKSEKIMKEEFFHHLAELDQDAKVMFKLSLPSEDNFFKDLLEDPRVVRIVALSGGYSRDEANEILARNKGIIASFSRALTEGLNVHQTDKEFNETLEKAVEKLVNFK